MSEPMNVQTFHAACALILGKLYENFPRPIVLKLDELAQRRDDETAAQWDDRLATYVATTAFLVEEGYMRAGNAVGGGTVIAKAVLTSKGLAALQRVPDPQAMSAAATVGSLLLETLREGTIEALRALVGAIFV